MIWKATPLCVLWTVWNERNIRTFGDVEESNHVIKQVMLHMTVLGSILRLFYFIFLIFRARDCNSIHILCI